MRQTLFVAMHHNVNRRPSGCKTQRADNLLVRKLIISSVAQISAFQDFLNDARPLIFAQHKAGFFQIAP
jgi:hypothetical protein